MKQLASILLILLLSFAGATSTMHHIEENEKHCHLEETHICAPDAHHRCSLCDTLLSSGLTSSGVFDVEKINQTQNATAFNSSAFYPFVDRISLGRAPPLG